MADPLSLQPIPMNEDIKLAASQLDRQWSGLAPEHIEVLKESGSARRYYRLSVEGSSAVMCISDNIKENHTFILLSRYLREKGLPVPEILAVLPGERAYLLQDLGDTDLLSFIKSYNLTSGERKSLLRRVVRLLFRFQRLPRCEWDGLVEFPPLDESLIEGDFNYAIENLFSRVPVEIDFDKLRGELTVLKERLLAFPKELWGLMYRDFQSRNIMLNLGPVLIDYQSARYGPGIYDLVSFAWQAKADFSREEREWLIDQYASLMGEYYPAAPKIIRRNVGSWALFRMIQTLGAYGLRGLKEGKPHFIESIPLALRNLSALLESDGSLSRFIELRSAVNKLKFYNFAEIS